MRIFHPKIRTVLLLVSFAAAGVLHAQISVYTESAASNLAGGAGGDYLFGWTLGVVRDVRPITKHVFLSGDLQFGYVEDNGERLSTLVVGPRVSFPFERPKLIPYAEFQIGFDRYRPNNDPGAVSTSDGIYGVDVGLARRLAPRVDVIVDYKYSQYGANSIQHTLMTYSAGLRFRFAKHKE